MNCLFQRLIDEQQCQLAEYENAAGQCVSELQKAQQQVQSLQTKIRESEGSNKVLLTSNVMFHQASDSHLVYCCCYGVVVSQQEWESLNSYCAEPFCLCLCVCVNRSYNRGSGTWKVNYALSEKQHVVRREQYRP